VFVKKRLQELVGKYVIKVDEALKSENEKLTARVGHLETVVDYLEYENWRIASLLRYAAGPVVGRLPLAQQTCDSFDFQWEKLPKGRWNLENDTFRKEAPGYVCQFTSLTADWFRGKKVADVGCGAGRYSWALCKLGAEVLSIDQSRHGLERTRAACKQFPGHRILQADLLDFSEIDETFDLVWCYGVLHHTGNTYKAFKRVVPLVESGGYLFLMLYGVPRKGITNDYVALNEYEYWRWKTHNMSFTEKLETVKRAMRERKFAVYGEEYIEGYYDAISPEINDLYTWEEIERWLVLEHFKDIKRTVDTRNHHVVARKSKRAD
jgi:SAM-dependent methyltransferase